MKNKVTSLTEFRQRKKPRTPEQTAEAAIRLILGNIPENLEEPLGFASGGDMSKILDECEKVDEKDD